MLNKSRIVVCLLNNKLRVNVEEANLRLTQIGGETRDSLMNLARSLGCPLNRISPTGVMPDLSDSKIKTVLQLYDVHASTRAECLIFLGLSVTSESHPVGYLIEVLAEPWSKND